MLHVCVPLSLLAVAAFAADPPREFRAAWVATVENIDWPSKKGLSADQQRQELVAIFGRCQSLNLNAVVLQVRPMADALYKSDLEPWSEFLTGTPGKDPGYDPLTFAVDEAHARGLELHCWFNPYRAGMPGTKVADLPASHVLRRRPDLAKPYGTRYWMNPTHPEVAAQSLAVFLDVVKRYDVDGIHMDDYFYPYIEKDKSTGKEIPFPDDDTWADYQKSGGRLARGDWRRAAVNKFVEDLYRETKKIKRHVKVGISPFGIWKPGFPAQIKGFDQYEGLYADARLWLNEGWVDYYTPQLYWPIDREAQSYPVLLKWWQGENTKQRHLWPGNNLSLGGDEIARQVEVTRAVVPDGGNVFFSMKSLMSDEPRSRTGKSKKPDDAAPKTAAAKSLRPLYARKALVPAMPWLGGEPPQAAPGLPAANVRWLMTDTPDGSFTLQFVKEGQPLPAGPGVHRAVSAAGVLGPAYGGAP